MMAVLVQNGRRDANGCIPLREFPKLRAVPRSSGGEARSFAWIRFIMAALTTWALMFPLTGVLGAPAEAKGSGYLGQAVSPQGPGRPGFTALAAKDTGIVFTNRLSDVRSATNRNLLSGSGVAAGDIDGDGWCDLYFCGLDSPSALYRNLGGWRFENITGQAGLGNPSPDSTGAVFADIDGDGDLDLLVSSMGGGVRLFLNDGRGHFTESTAASGLSSKLGSMSMALADIDGDGDLDLYVANYRPSTIRDRPSTQFRMQHVGNRPVVVAVDGRPATAPDLTNRFELSPTGDVLEYSEPSDLFINDGHGHFERASFTDGRFLDEDGQPLRTAPLDWSLSVRFYDWTGDGAPDLYVCNDLFSPDRAWINDGKGHFRAMPRLGLRHTSSFSMGVDFADLNRDGHPDFMVVDMLSRDWQMKKIQIAGLSPNFTMPGEISNRPQFFQNTLQVNRGDGTFYDVAWFAGVEASEWSWHPIALDVDLDGFEDILIPNGMLRDFQNMDLGEKVEKAVASQRVSNQELVRMFGEFPGLFTPNVAFRNRGDLTFEECGRQWGFATAGISQGLALADLDNDGDLDLVVNNLREGATLFRNESTAPRVLVRLKGAAPNTRGIGARLRVLGGPVEQTQEIVAGGRYLSSDEPARCFAAGTNRSGLTIEVTWRSGRRTTVTEVPANTVCVIEETNTLAGATRPAPVSPWFEDVSARLPHQHHQEPFDEFSRQPLLPKDLSQAGPGVCWTDLDGDGLEDLVIGTGLGGKMGAFRGDGKGGFTPFSGPPFDRVFDRATTALISGMTLHGHPVLLAGSSNYEDGAEAGSMARLFDLTARTLADPLPGQSSSVGPLSAADLDGDGDLDVFVGGRVVPGKYPLPASSFLFLHEGDRFKLDARNLSALINLGLVNGSVFTDLDNDGDPDLVLAMEWSSPRVFRNEAGLFKDVTAEWGLAPYTGWWQSVAAGDFDGDGRMDLIAGNWGLNNAMRASPEQPYFLYYGDFAGRGQVDLLEAVMDLALEKIVPARDLRILSLGLPPLRERFQSHQQFSRASVPEVLGDAFAASQRLQVTAMASMIFLNRGNRFEARPLPAPAQFSPVFGLAVADVDGDGKEDVFLAQNFFAVQPLASRQDAGEGLWLLGDGQGGFRPLSGSSSGIHLYGQQRGAAVADFDHDGRVDLAVAQNGSVTGLFRNAKAKPGLRVRLQGPPGNPTGIGAVMRLDFGGKWSPAREVHAGAGYWSQDSSIQVMALPAAPQRLLVKWPGGRETTTPIPAQAREITVQAPGN